MKVISYKTLYQEQKMKNIQLQKDKIILSQRIIYLENELEKITTREITNMKQNNINIANSPIKIKSHLLEFSKTLSTQHPKQQYLCQKLCLNQFLKKYKVQYTLFFQGELIDNKLFARSNSNLFQSKWVISQKLQFSDIQSGYVKSLLQLNTSCAYSHKQHTKDYSYTYQLKSTEQQQYYLSISVVYKHIKGYNWPKLYCFVSNQKINIEYLETMLQVNNNFNSIKFNKQILLGSQRIRYNIKKNYFALSNHYQFANKILLSILLEKSILIKSAYHQKIAKFIYTVINYLNIQLPHIINYNLTDIELMDLPVPFIFGMIKKQVDVMDEQYYKDIIIIDLDNSKVVNMNEDTKNIQISQLIQILVKIINNQNEFDLCKIKALVKQVSNKPMREFLEKYICTINFRHYFQIKNSII